MVCEKECVKNMKNNIQKVTAQLYAYGLDILKWVSDKKKMGR